DGRGVGGERSDLYPAVGGGRSHHQRVNRCPSPTAASLFRPSPPPPIAAPSASATAASSPPSPSRQQRPPYVRPKTAPKFHPLPPPASPSLLATHSLPTRRTKSLSTSAPCSNGTRYTRQLPSVWKKLCKKTRVFEAISIVLGCTFMWQRMNLTAVTEEREVMSRHVEDSLAILPPLWRSYLSHCCSSSPCDGLNVVDVGSGAGLPGLILAIACPSNHSATLLFLCHLLTIKLYMFLLDSYNGQNVGQSIDYRELFDVAVARAVAEMRTLAFFNTAEYCLPLVRVGGLFIAAKGSDPQVKFIFLI
ncbi:hypothetical protein B296_00055107, partial [Ensete ventricosum]